MATSSLGFLQPIPHVLPTVEGARHLHEEGGCRLGEPVVPAPPPRESWQTGGWGSLLRLWASGQGGKQDPPHMGAASAKQAHLGHARQVGGLVCNQVPASPMLPALSPSGTQGPAPLWCVQPADTHVTLLHSWPFCCWTDLPCSDSPPRGHQPSLAPGPAPPPPGQQPSSSFLPAPRPRLPSP